MLLGKLAAFDNVYDGPCAKRSHRGNITSRCKLHLDIKYAGLQTLVGERPEKAMGIPIQRRTRAQIQTSHNSYNDTAHEVRTKWHLKLRIDLGKVRGERNAPIPREAPAQTTLPSMARRLAEDAGGYDECFQSDGTAFGSQSSVEEC